MVEVHGDRLMGWKAIGNFVGRDARTARRWEAERGLPVHRIPGGGGASVWADSAALRLWLGDGRDDRGTAPAPAGQGRRPWRWLVPAILLGALALSWAARGGGSDPLAAASAPYGDDAAANATFQSARYAMNTRSVAGLTDATRQFGRLAHDRPRNAAAFVGLAETNLLLREFNGLPDEIAYRRAEQAARQALAIDPRSPGGLRALAFIRYWSDGDRAQAFELFRRAIAADPNDAQSRHWYGTALFGDGRFAEALAALDRARTLNPGSSAIATDEAIVRYLSGDRAGAVASLKRVTEIDPGFSGAHRHLAAIYLVEGDDRGFLTENATTARLTHDPVLAGMIAEAAAAQRAGGRRAMLSALIGWAERAYRDSGGRAILAAQMHAVAGERDAALRWLARAETVREPEIAALRAYPSFVRYRDDPAFGRYFGGR